MTRWEVRDSPVGRTRMMTPPAASRRFAAAAASSAIVRACRGSAHGCVDGRDAKKVVESSARRFSFEAIPGAASGTGRSAGLDE